MLGAGAASAQSAINLNGPGFIEAGEDCLFLAASEGIYRVSADGATQELIFSGRASALKYHGGRLYYLNEVYGENEYGDTGLISQTPMSCLPDGSDSKTLGDTRRVGSVTVFPESEDDPLTYDMYVGYRDFTVYKDHIYYLSNSSEGGEYISNGVWMISDTESETESRRAVYLNGIALYRADLDGGNETKLTGVLGNSIARLAIADDKIYVGAGYLDAVYAYNYVNYMVYTLEGELIAQYHDEQNDSRTLYSDAGEFYHITDAVLADDAGMIVSLSDSEGDFNASQLFRIATDGALTLLAVEQQFIPSVLDGDTLYAVTSESNTTYFDYDYDYNATLGIYKRALADEGLGEKLVALPYNEYLYDFRFSVLNEVVYFRGADGILYRIKPEGADFSLEKLTRQGFIASGLDYKSIYE